MQQKRVNIYLQTIGKLLGHPREQTQPENLGGHVETAKIIRGNHKWTDISQKRRTQTNHKTFILIPRRARNWIQIRFRNLRNIQ